MLKNAKFWLVLITFILITATGFVYGQPWYRMLPLYISLIIMLLQTRANRYAYLVGGINAGLYAVVYASLTLYGSALYAALVSFPLQIVTFIRWNKNKYGNTTVFKRLTNQKRLLGVLVLALVWIALYFVLSALGSAYLILDNTVTILGIVATVMTVFAYIEAPYITLLSSACSIVLYVQMMQETPAQITYLIYTVYSFICVTASLMFMQKTYKLQQEGNV